MPPEFKSRVASKISKFRAQVQAFTRKTLQRGGARYVRDMHARMSGPTGPNSLSARTGAGRRSVRFATVPIANGMRLEMAAGGNAFYLIVHENGATIRPRSAKYLAIPIGAAKTKAGVSRQSGPRQYPDLKFVIARSGKKLLVRVLPKTKRQPARIVPMYVLVPVVNIPPRLGFKKTVKEVARGITADLKAGFRALAKRAQ